MPKGTAKHHAQLKHGRGPVKPRLGGENAIDEAPDAVAFKVCHIHSIHLGLTGMTVLSVRGRAGGLRRFTKRAMQMMQVEEAGVQPDAPEPLNWKNRPPHIFRSRASGFPHQAGIRVRFGSPKG